MTPVADHYTPTDFWAQTQETVAHTGSQPDEPASPASSGDEPGSSPRPVPFRKTMRSTIATMLGKDAGRLTRSTSRKTPGFVEFFERDDTEAEYRSINRNRTIAAVLTVSLLGFGSWGWVTNVSRTSVAAQTDLSETVVSRYVEQYGTARAELKSLIREAEDMLATPGLEKHAPDAYKSTEALLPTVREVAAELPPEAAKPGSNLDVMRDSMNAARECVERITAWTEILRDATSSLSGSYTKVLVNNAKAALDGAVKNAEAVTDHAQKVASDAQGQVDDPGTLTTLDDALSATEGPLAQAKSATSLDDIRLATIAVREATSAVQSAYGKVLASKLAHTEASGASDLEKANAQTAEQKAALEEATSELDELRAQLKEAQAEIERLKEQAETPPTDVVPEPEPSKNSPEPESKSLP